jgi:hypothetical protein
VQSLRAELLWTPSAPGDARAVVRAWLEAAECDGRVATDLVLAVSELVTRAVNSCPAPPVLECSWDLDGVRIVVGSAPMLGGPEDVLDTVGDLGAAVLWAICDRWGVVDDALSTSLWAHVPVPM